MGRPSPCRFESKQKYRRRVRSHIQLRELFGAVFKSRERRQQIHRRYRSRAEGSMMRAVNGSGTAL